MAFNATGQSRVLTPDAATLDDAPARRFHRGINVLSPGFGFVHGPRSRQTRRGVLMAFIVEMGGRL